jgi:hypothetical protein
MKAIIAALMTLQLAFGHDKNYLFFIIGKR